MANITNRRASFDYEITSKVVAGIVLRGSEVKALRKGSAHLKGAFVSFKNGEAWLTNAHIGPYKYAHPDAHENDRSRKLLLTKRQISELQNAKNSGMNVVALRIIVSSKYIKVELGIGRSKKQFDKRNVIKKRDLDIEMGREFRSQ